MNSSHRVKEECSALLPLISLKVSQDVTTKAQSNGIRYIFTSLQVPVQVYRTHRYSWIKYEDCVIDILPIFGHKIADFWLLHAVSLYFFVHGTIVMNKAVTGVK